MTEFVISLGKFGEAEHLHGDVKLKEGAGVTLTRVDADNAIEIASAGGAAAPCFGNSWLWYASTGAPMPVGAISHDYADLGCTAIGQDYHLYTPPQWGLGLNKCQRLEFRIAKSSIQLWSPIIMVGIMLNQHNIIDNPNAEGMWLRTQGQQVYAVNANGLGQKSTYLFDYDWTVPYWIRIDRRLNSIEFYANGILRATHTTYLPTALKWCIFVFQLRATDNFPRGCAITHPQFSSCLE